MSFLENCIIPFYRSIRFLYFLTNKRELLTSLRVLHVYFYSVTVFSVRVTISHMVMDLFQHTLSENKRINC